MLAQCLLNACSMLVHSHVYPHTYTHAFCGHNVQVFEKLIDELSTADQYKEALTVATAMQTQLSLSFTAEAADMLSKVEDHIKKYATYMYIIYIHALVNVAF